MNLILNFFVNIIRYIRYIISLKGRTAPIKLSNTLTYNFHIIKNLRNDGISVIKNSVLKINEIDELIKTTDNIQLKDFKKPGMDHGAPFKVFLNHLVDEKLLLSIAYNHKLINIAKSYFGIEPNLRYVSLWLDFLLENQANPTETQLWHRDGDDPFLLKIFIYLRDTNLNNGPFTYFKGSHKQPWLNPSQNNLGKSDNTYLNLKKGRFTDYDINNYYKFDTSLIATGKAGTIVIADTNGFHKGLLPVQGERLLLTINYTSSKPIHGFFKNPINPSNEECENFFK